MTIVEFYQELTQIMQNYESQYDNIDEARKNLKGLLAKAKKAKLTHVNVSIEILDDIDQIDPEESSDPSMIC